GDVVLGVASAGGGLRRVLRRGRRRDGRPSIVGTAEELDPLRPHLRRRPLVPLPIGPLASLQRSLDVDRPPLPKVLAGALRLLPPDDDAVPLRALLLLAGGVLPGVGRGHREIGHRLAALRVADLRVTAEIPDENDLVDTRHGRASFRRGGAGDPSNRRRRDYQRPPSASNFGGETALPLQCARR